MAARPMQSWCRRAPSHQGLHQGIAAGSFLAPPGRGVWVGEGHLDTISGRHRPWSMGMSSRLRGGGSRQALGRRARARGGQQHAREPKPIGTWSELGARLHDCSGRWMARPAK